MTTAIRITEAFDRGHIKRAGDNFASSHTMSVFEYGKFTYMERGYQHRACGLVTDDHRNNAATFIFLARYTARVPIPPGYTPPRIKS